jgi:hypothetical protein
MSRYYQISDLVVCRSGASTIAELAVCGKTAILIPYPYAAHDHQFINAQKLVAFGAVRMIPDKELNGSTLSETILDLYHHPEERRRMEERIRKIGRPRAAEEIVNHCCARWASACTCPYRQFCHRRRSSIRKQLIETWKAVWTQKIKALEAEAEAIYKEEIEKVEKRGGHTFVFRKLYGEAEFNFQLAKKGNGIHNPEYTEELIEIANLGHQHFIPVTERWHAPDYFLNRSWCQQYPLDLGDIISSADSTTLQQSKSSSTFTFIRVPLDYVF